MADGRKMSEMTVTISGQVDPSLANAVGLSQAEIRKLNDALRTVNSAINSDGVQAYRNLGIDDTRTWRRIARRTTI
jgi:hypothetical protein